MKYIKNIIFLTCILLISAITHSQQKNNPKLYIRGDIGASIAANKFKDIDYTEYIEGKPKTAAVYNIGFGYIISDKFRADLNINYRKFYYKVSEIELEMVSDIRQKIYSYNVAINGYWDIINIGKTITPYITAGAGYGRNKTSTAISTMEWEVTDTHPGETRYNFIWSIGLGTKIILKHDRFNLDIFYKFTNLGKSSMKDSLENPTTTFGDSQKLKTHDIMAGLIVYI